MRKGERKEIKWEVVTQPELIEDIYPKILETLKKEEIPYLMGYLPEIDKLTKAALSDPDNWPHFLDVLLRVKPKLVYVNPWEFDEDSIERLADFVIGEELDTLRKKKINVKSENLERIREKIVKLIKRKYKQYYEKYERLTISYVMENVFHNISIIPQWAENMFFDAIGEAEKFFGPIKKQGQLVEEDTEKDEGDARRPKLHEIYR
ncbi:MAG: hypothetical protein N3F63_04195 [Thermoplasmata archaeon]|nr:hypothetical protein [Thermoplasmata archaeon]